MKRNLVTSFGHELATVVAALLGSSASAAPGEASAPGDGWATTIDTDTAARGSWTVVIGAEGANALTAAIMGLTGEVPPAAVADTLHEALHQAVAAVSLLDVAAGVELRAGEVVPNAAPELREEATTLVVTSTALSVPLTIVVAGEVDVTVPAAARGGAATKTSKAPGADPLVAPASSERLDAILDIELPLIVRFGRTELPLRALAHLGPGSLIDLGRSADDPVDLLVSNRVVARGEVVVVGGNYGVRVLDVVSPRDRARPMEA
ncbi:MAG TPA: FliM/FliN family flagellar motor switch protein [Vicinamibacterales bacterium]